MKFLKMMMIVMKIQLLKIQRTNEGKLCCLFLLLLLLLICSYRKLGKRKRDGRGAHFSKKARLEAENKAQGASLAWMNKTQNRKRGFFVASIKLIM